MNTIYTVGHSTRKFSEFLEILKAYRIDLLVDVRTMPRSRHVPQFNSEALSTTLPQEGIDYMHVPALGGLRKTLKDSPNGGWRNKSFRGYADYMQTDEFKSGVAEICALAHGKTIALMCAEAVPWRCHRSLIGDALLVCGANVVDIFDAHTAAPEKITSFAQVHDTDIVYPPYED